MKNDTEKILDIIYEDKYFAVVNKPVGMASQNNGGNDLVYFAGKYTGGEVFIINRLDQPVGGLVLLAKDKETAAKLSETDIEKHYLTVVCGCPEESGRLENYLMHNKRLNLTKAVNKGMGKHAVLEYKKIWQNADNALLDVRLITGRHHQIRAQMQSNGTPIWGDTKYNPTFKHKRGCSPALFSYTLAFSHPFTNENMFFKAEPKDEIYKNIE